MKKVEQITPFQKFTQLIAIRLLASFGRSNFHHLENCILSLSNIQTTDVKIKTLFFIKNTWYLQRIPLATESFF